MDPICGHHARELSAELRTDDASAVVSVGPLFSSTSCCYNNECPVATVLVLVLASAAICSCALLLAVSAVWTCILWNQPSF